jgi:NitT/TauT family transport system ATP-binding protein
MKTRTDDPPRKISALPANVRAGQVISLVEVTGGLGSTIDASRLAYELGADIAVLLPILDTAEMLGLVKVEKGEVSLTEFGQKFQKTSRNKVRLLTDQLAKIEPFKTALELVASKGEVDPADVAEALHAKGITWHHEPEMNESLVRAILIHWGIYGGLVSYNKDGKFEPFKR